ncbi:MAG TPA: SDR family oxidoreductase [Hellea balneolensis]|uniref:SDR family oxidoreductase n=1 Tax=Hellea balneolensis TaxID=287478 RepID=A0A7C3C5E1_9PROT|nr:SDR family oxidoreductase [Hellea balneolensis]
MTRHALITGGGSGIGLACAQRLSRDGYKVTIAGRHEDRLKAAKFPYVVMDVTSAESIQDGFTAAINQNGPIDIVISNAGAAQTAPALKTSQDMWDTMIAVNLTGAFLCAQAALPPMVEQGFGRFIVIASTAALKAYPYTMAYTAAKHGVLGMVKGLAVELAKTGVTCNAICPGFTDTDIVRGAVKNIMDITGRSQEKALSAFIKDNPMNRLIAPDEIADSASWLCGKGASSVNGQAIIIDGGECIS